MLSTMRQIDKEARYLDNRGEVGRISLTMTDRLPLGSGTAPACRQIVGIFQSLKAAYAP